MLIIVVVLVGGGIAALIIIRGGGSTTTASTTAGNPTTVRLEPISSATDPFAPPGQVGQDVAVTPVETNGPTVVEGGRPGLYGGTMDSSKCDKNQLTTFLQQNPDKGAAWAKVLGISPDQIPTYVAGLTPLLLRSDTAVTNHGFVNGQATSMQSVLQAGTAVLVDEKGQPVTKCYCGNPLQPPISFTPPKNTTTTYNQTTTTYDQPTTTYYESTTTTYYEPPTFDGQPWPGFKDTSITIIQVNVTVINVFVVVDPQTGQTFNRPAGTDGSQDTPADPAATTTTATGASPTPSTSGPGGQPTTTAQPTPSYPDERCVDEHNNIVPCPGYPTTTYYQTTTTMLSEPCVDENNNIVPCPK